MKRLKIKDVKYSKLLFDEMFKEYTLTEDDLEKLHKTLLKMMIDFKTVCDKYKIEYMLAGGTALGAVRNEGFIPWDDDVDIIMTRSNYEKFSSVAMQELDNEYVLAEPMDKNYYFHIPKLYLKNTECVDLLQVGTPPDYHMIYFDLFIADYAPQNSVIRLVKGCLYKFAVASFVCCRDYLFPSEPILKKMENNRQLKRYYSMRRFFGRILNGALGIDTYLFFALKLEKAHKKTNKMAVLSGNCDYKECFDAEHYLNLKKVKFEGVDFTVSKYCHDYFICLYGDDYMTPPPEDKREKHLIYSLKFPE